MSDLDEHAKEFLNKVFETKTSSQEIAKILTNLIMCVSLGCDEPRSFLTGFIRILEGIEESDYIDRYQEAAKEFYE